MAMRISLVQWSTLVKKLMLLNWYTIELYYNRLKKSDTSSIPKRMYLLAKPEFLTKRLQTKRTNHFRTWAKGLFYIF
jgi:hypothetical protein